MRPVFQSPEHFLRRNFAPSLALWGEQREQTCVCEMKETDKEDREDGFSGHIRGYLVWSENRKSAIAY